MSMTAQAGAVAAWISEYNIGVLREYAADGYSAHVKICNARNLTNTIPLYLTPPAAVPVEALEGLVEAVRSVVSMPLEEFLAFDNTPGNKRIFGANDWNLAVGNIRRLRAALANTERLIKERSNG